MDVTITRHGDAQSGEYHAHIDGSDHIGRLTWVERGGARVADHTLVPPPIGGRGVAMRLVEAMVADARAQGFTIIGGRKKKPTPTAPSPTSNPMVPSI